MQKRFCEINSKTTFPYKSKCSRLFCDDVDWSADNNFHATSMGNPIENIPKHLVVRCVHVSKTQ